MHGVASFQGWFSAWGDLILGVIQCTGWPHFRGDLVHRVAPFQG